MDPPHGISLSSELSRGFTWSGGENEEKEFAEVAHTRQLLSPVMAAEMACPSSLALDVSPGFFHPSASLGLAGDLSPPRPFGLCSFYQLRVAGEEETLFLFPPVGLGHSKVLQEDGGRPGDSQLCPRRSL